MEVNSKHKYINNINITGTSSYLTNITNDLKNEFYRRTYFS